MSAIQVPLFDLPAQYARIRDEVREALDRVLESQRFVLGPEVAAFEAEFAAVCGSPVAVGCGSGTDALTLALMASGVGPGDDVLVPAFSFIATATSVLRVGARPHFVDVDPDDLLLDPRAAERAARRCPRLRAIVPVHLFGRCAELEPLRALAERHGAALVEDAAQAVGARDARGRAAGAIGDIGAFSLYPTKNLGAYGEAGVLVTGDPEAAERLRGLRSHGQVEPYRHARFGGHVGLNSRLDELQAAVLRVKLRHLDAWTKQRQAHAEQLTRALLDAGAVASVAALRDSPLALRVPEPPPAPARHVFHHYVVRTRPALRDAFRAELADRGIETGVYYPSALHRQDCFALQGDALPDCPASDAAAAGGFALPVHPELRTAQLARIVEAVVEVGRALAARQ